jgi:hypothetical protein
MHELGAFSDKQNKMEEIDEYEQYGLTFEVAY